MKKINLHLIIPFFLSLFIFSACSDVEFVLSNLPQKVEGSWEFERVRFRQNWAIDGDDVTHDYRNFTMHFYDNGDLSIEYPDNRGNIRVDFGYWEVEKHEECNHNDCDIDRFLHFELEDPENGIFDYNTWEMTFVGVEKIKAREIYSNGVYKYKLRQLY